MKCLKWTEFQQLLNCVSKQVLIYLSTLPGEGPSPVYTVAGRIIDFEKRFPKEISLGKDIEAHGFWLVDVNTNSMAMQSDDIQGL